MCVWETAAIWGFAQKLIFGHHSLGLSGPRDKCWLWLLWKNWVNGVNKGGFTTSTHGDREEKHRYVTTYWSTVHVLSTRNIYIEKVPLVFGPGVEFIARALLPGRPMCQCVKYTAVQTAARPRHKCRSPFVLIFSHFQQQNEGVKTDFDILSV